MFEHVVRCAVSGNLFESRAGILQIGENELLRKLPS
jgi:hypothetical protein